MDSFLRRRLPIYGKGPENAKAQKHPPSVWDFSSNTISFCMILLVNLWQNDCRGAEFLGRPGIKWHDKNDEDMVGAVVAGFELKQHNLWREFMGTHILWSGTLSSPTQSQWWWWCLWLQDSWSIYMTWWWETSSHIQLGNYTNIMWVCGSTVWPE